MKRSSIIAAALAAFAIAFSGAAAAADQAAQPQKVKHLQVRNAAEVRGAFGFAAAGGRQAIEISCAPASSTWCAKDFVTACDNAKGGMSSGPDGVTCSLPQHE